MSDPATFRVLVTGSRVAGKRDTNEVWWQLELACRPALNAGIQVVIVEGRCETGGIDRAAQVWAESTTGVISEGHPADWETYARFAGPLRNTEMVKLGANLCLAFPRPGSRGTWDCIRKAVDASIQVRIYPLHGSETDS